MCVLPTPAGPIMTTLQGLLSQSVFMNSIILSLGTLGLNFQSKSLISLILLIPDILMRYSILFCVLFWYSPVSNIWRNSLSFSERVVISVSNRKCFHRSDKFIIVAEIPPFVIDAEEPGILGVYRVVLIPGGLKETLYICRFVDFTG